MRTTFGFVLLLGLVLASLPGCAKAPAAPAAPADPSVQPEPVEATAAETPEPKNPYEGIGDAHLRSLAERADRFLVPAAKLGGQAFDAIKVAEERARAIIQLEQYRLELTPEGERKLLELAKQISKRKAWGSLGRFHVGIETYGQSMQQRMAGTVFGPSRIAWFEADSLLREKLHAGTFVPRELRLAVSAFDPSAVNNISLTELPDLETKVIRLELHGDDLLPFLFRVYELAEDVEWHRDQDKKLHAMIQAFVEPLDRAKILHRMYRVQPGAAEGSPLAEEASRAARFAGATRSDSKGIVEVDMAAIEEALHLKARFFPWLRPATEAELRKIWGSQDAGKGALRNPNEIYAERNQEKIGLVFASNEWKAFFQDELTPFVHKKELERITRFATLSTKADRAAIENLFQSQGLLKELESVFTAGHACMTHSPACRNQPRMSCGVTSRKPSPMAS